MAHVVSPPAACDPSRCRTQCTLPDSSGSVSVTREGVVSLCAGPRSPGITMAWRCGQVPPPSLPGAAASVGAALCFLPLPPPAAFLSAWPGWRGSGQVALRAFGKGSWCGRFSGALVEGSRAGHDWRG